MRSAARWRPRDWQADGRGFRPASAKVGTNGQRARSLGGADRCRHRRAEGRPRADLQGGDSQLNKASDRLDKVEKAQAEPAAKLAKLSETVDKLSAPPQASAPAAVAGRAGSPRRTVTGSIPQPAAAAAAAPAPAPPPKPEVARLPTVEGWVLRDVANGGALIEGRRGMYEVYAGDPVPGLGRVDAIRKQDGRWVVVTSKGLIVAR